MSNSTKIAKGVIVEKLKFMRENFINVFFNEKERILKAFVMRNAQNLFGTDWIEEFHLFNVPINNFCNKIDGTTTCSHKLKKELKVTFPETFPKEHGVKENVMPVSRPKRSVPYVSVEILDKD